MSRWAEAFAAFRKRDTCDTCDTLRNLEGTHPEPDAGVTGVTGVKGVTPVEIASDGPPDAFAGFVALSTGSCPGLDACDGWCDACRAIRDTRLPPLGTPERARLDRDQAAAVAGLLAGFRSHAEGGR